MTNMTRVTDFQKIKRKSQVPTNTFLVQEELITEMNK